MKVGIDGILLGVWVDFFGVEKILDIGIGIGLIVLMLVQCLFQGLGILFFVNIDVVEIDFNLFI